MKIGMLQLNFTVGDVEGNARKIMDGYRSLCEQGAELVVTSELALLGYPIKDLIFSYDVINRQSRQLQEILAIVGDVGLIIGVAERTKEGGLFTNCAYFCHNGEVIHIQQKYLLPTYDVFDERRYFEPNGETIPVLVKYKGQRLAILICEDIWGGNEVDDGLYDYKPVSELAKVLPDILITLNASPFYVDKAYVRYGLAQRITEKIKCPIVYVNQVGGNDDLVFDGSSFVCTVDGQFLAIAPSFEESAIVVDVAMEMRLEYSRVCKCSEEEQILSALVLGTRDYINKCGFKKALVALSGGIDSAVTAAIACLAIGSENVVGYALPSEFSSQGSIDDARSLAINLGIDFSIIPIGDIYNSFGDSLKFNIGWNVPGAIDNDATEENIQARCRGTIMMAISNRTGAILLTTGNKSEISVGYFTMYGDAAGGFAVIADVYKTMIYRLAKYINREREIIPDSTITKAPSAELRPDQCDSDSLPPYDVLDKILLFYIEHGFSPEAVLYHNEQEATAVHRVIQMVNRSEHKRKQMPPGLKISKKAFGSGRRMPIAAKY